MADRERDSHRLHRREFFKAAGWDEDALETYRVRFGGFSRGRGVELTVGGERPIHFLVIFAVSTPVEQIASTRSSRSSDG